MLKPEGAILVLYLDPLGCQLRRLHTGPNTTDLTGPLCPHM